MIAQITGLVVCSFENGGTTHSSLGRGNDCELMAGDTQKDFHRDVAGWKGSIEHWFGRTCRVNQRGAERKGEVADKADANEVRCSKVSSGGRSSGDRVHEALAAAPALSCPSSEDEPQRKVS